MILVNGSIGIGTGFSTNIPCYKPSDIIRYIRNRLNGDNEVLDKLIPWYRNFKGEIKQDVHGNVSICGNWKRLISKTKTIVNVNELPIGVWNENFKILLEKLIDKQVVKEYNDMSTDKNVDFNITFNKLVSDDEVVNSLNLVVKKNINNMHAFDGNQCLRKFNTPEDIIDYFIPIRLSYYNKRKAQLLDILKNELCILKNKTRFINEQIDETIDLRGKKRDVVVEYLKAKKYDMIPDDTQYKYLRSMPIDSFIVENVETLIKQKNEKEQILNQIENTTINDMWLDELKLLESLL